MNEIINSLLIPYSPEDGILIPRTVVECTLPYAPPLPTSYEHNAIIGSLIYKDAKVPVLDLNGLDDSDLKPSVLRSGHGKHRLVILTCASSKSFCDSYAVVASNEPMPVEVTENSLRELNRPAESFFFSKVGIGIDNEEKSAYIPNLEKIEEVLFAKKFIDSL